METKTLKTLIDEGIREIYVRSYGYNELSCLGNTWQPWGNKAKLVKFTIYGYGDYSNPVFFFDDEEPSLEDRFKLESENRWVSLQDFDLACRG